MLVPRSTIKIKINILDGATPRSEDPEQEMNLDESSDTSRIG